MSFKGINNSALFARSNTAKAVLSACLVGMAFTTNASTPFQGTRAGGMASAFVGQADDPSAIAHNPAGLAFVKGTHVYQGITAIMPSTEYTDPTGETFKTETRIFLPPNLFASTDEWFDSVVVGVGMYSPFGIGGRKWSKTGPTRYISTLNQVATAAINPTVAFNVSPDFSFGFGVSYIYAKSEAERMLDQSAFNAPDAKVYLDGDGDGWSYNAGLMWKLDQLSFGLAYRSTTKVDLSGRGHISNIAEPLRNVFDGQDHITGFKADLELPDIISFGVSYRYSEDLTVNFDYEIYGWSTYDTVLLDFDNEVPAANFVDAPAVYDWKDAAQIKLGGEYKLNEQIALRAGYAYLEAQVPDHTLTPISPEGDQHNFSIGAGYKVGNMSFDAYYMYTEVEKRKANVILVGEYDNTLHFFGVGMNYTF